MQRRLFALDQNFPEPILAALSRAVPMAELVPLRTIRKELAEVEDWQLLLALHQDERPWDGLVTNDRQGTTARTRFDQQAVPDGALVFAVV